MIRGSKLVLILLLGLMPFPVVAQPMADRLPASTLVYTGWSPGASLQNTMAAKMLADDRLVQPWRTVLQKVLLSLPEDIGAGGGAKISEHFPRLLAEASQCEGCFALLDLKQDKKELSPQAVLIINLGARRKTFEEHFQPIHARLKERLGDRIQMMKLENSWLWVKTTKERAEYTWGFLGDSFVFYFGDGGEKFLPTLSGAKPAASLKNAADFSTTMSKIPGESVLTTYVDAKGFLTRFQMLIKDANDEDLRMLLGNWDKVMGGLGVDNVVALGEKTTVQDDQFVTRSLLHTDGPPHGLVSALVQPAVDDAMLKVVPPDAMFVAAARLDLSKTYDQVKAATIAVAGEDGKKAFADVEDAAAGFGIPVKELLDPLGDQWVIYEAASTGGFFFTGLTLVVDVKDVDKLGRTLSTLKRLIAKSFDKDEHVALGEYEADGVTIQFLQTSTGFSPFTPAWAVAEKKLIIAFYPQVVEDAARQCKANKSILDNPQFVETLKRTGGGGPAFYLSGTEFVRSVYPIALPFLSALRELGFSGGPDDPSFPTAELLPSLQRLLTYVGSDGVSVKVTPDGFLRTKSVANPLLSPLTLIDSVPLWVAVALPSLGEARMTAERVKSSSNLRQIGQGMLLYANENKGKLPPDLATVLKTQDMTKEVFQSPFGDGKADTDYKYLYADGMTATVPADIAVVYDAAELEHGDGANVLYGDGHVEWLDHNAVTAAIEKASKWREELKAKPK